MDNKSFAAACLAATLTTAWAATPAEAAQADYFLKIDTVPGESLAACSVLWGSGTLTLAGSGSFSIGPSSWQGTVAISGDTADYDMPWMVLGVLADQPGHVSMCMPGLTAIGGIDFSQVFPPAIYGQDEQSLYNALSSGASTGQMPPSVSSFMIQARDQYGNGRPGDESTLWAFSQGLDIGTMTFSLVPVPEPTTLGAAFAAALVIGHRRRRRSLA